MTNGFDPGQRSVFLLGRLVAVAAAVQIAVNAFDCFEQSAGRFRLPHFAEAAASETFQQSIAGNRLGLLCRRSCHETDRPRLAVLNDGGEQRTTMIGELNHPNYGWRSGKCKRREKIQM